MFGDSADLDGAATDQSLEWDGDDDLGCGDGQGDDHGTVVNPELVDSTEDVARAFPCTHCKGDDALAENRSHRTCDHCNGIGFVCGDPELPCPYPKGSPEKLAVLAGRYRDGLPLWQEADCKYTKPTTTPRNQNMLPGVVGASQREYVPVGAMA